MSESSIVPMPQEDLIQAQPETTATAGVGHCLLLDSRRALVHPQEKWLVVADLHLGYALERQRRGGLFPDYGDDELVGRLESLLDDHQPETLILAGDIVDGSAAPEPGLELLERLTAKAGLELILLRGNHDRALQRHLINQPQWTLRACHQLGRFVFHHGDAPGRAAALPMLRDLGAAAIEISAHLHPAAVLRDRAGTRLKLPALWSYPFTHEGEDAPGWQRYILPAFSTWAAGVAPDARAARDIGQPNRIWACAPGRVFPIPL